MKTVYDYFVKDRKGAPVALKEYANEVLLIVNTATQCGFTPQYEALEKLYETYHSRGFETSLVNKHLAPTKAFTSFASSITIPSFHALKR